MSRSLSWWEWGEYISEASVIVACGGDEPVADGGAPGHSIFAWAILQSLSQMSPDEFTDAELTAIIRNGKSKMPAYAGKLSDQDISYLVAYIRLLKE